jgi:hypothetical protein
VEEKMWGHESNKSSKYNQSPSKYQNKVLEQRVFKTPKPTQQGPRKKKRAQTAGKLSENGFPKAKFANPNERP